MKVKMKKRTVALLLLIFAACFVFKEYATESGASGAKKPSMEIPQSNIGGLDKVPIINDEQRSFIFIGDSYQVGAFCGKEEFSWLDYLLLAHEDEMEKMYRNEISGYGFAKSEIKFINLLKEVDAIVDDKDSITDVVTICGYNDQNCLDYLYDGVKTYVEHIRATYPNARIWIFPVEWTTNENLERVKKVHEIVKGAADELGYIVCTGPEYVIMGDRICPDGIHPTVAGQIALGNAIAEALGLSRYVHSDEPANGLYTVKKLDQSRTSYYEDGVRQWKLNGFCKQDDTIHYLKDGDLYTDVSGILYGWDTSAKENKWYYVVNGVVDEKYTGFAENENGWWYIQNGEVDFEMSKVIKGTVKGKTGWWNVKGGKVQFTDSFAENENGWWYCKNGMVDFDKTGVIKGTVKDETGWWNVKGGKVQFYDSFAENENGWWYCKNGMVDFNKNSVIKGTVKGKTGWWNVKGGKVQFYDSFAENENGWWYCKGGKVDFNKNSVIKGTVKSETGWWNVRGGKVQFGDTVANNENGWWYCRGGKVDFNFEGIARNQNGNWYCKGGKVVFDYSGTVNYNGAEYKIKNGKVVE